MQHADATLWIELHRHFVRATCTTARMSSHGVKRYCGGLEVALEKTRSMQHTLVTLHQLWYPLRARTPYARTYSQTDDHVFHRCPN
jgi:hypothetical protein